MAKSGPELLAGRPDADYLRVTRVKLIEIVNSLGLTRGLTGLSKVGILGAFKRYVREARRRPTDPQIRTAFGIPAPPRRPRAPRAPSPPQVPPPGQAPGVGPAPPPPQAPPVPPQVPGVGPAPPPPQAPPPGQAPPASQRIDFPVKKIEKPRARSAEPNSTDIQDILRRILKALERKDPELIPPYNRGLGIDPEADDPIYKVPSEAGLTVSNAQAFMAALSIAYPIGSSAEVSFVKMTTSGSPARYLFADRGSTYPFRGRGPVWQSNSCAVDTVIVAAMFLDAGLTTADKGTATRTSWMDSLTATQRTFLDTINLDWRSISVQKSIELRDIYLEMYLRTLKSNRSPESRAPELKKGMFMSAIAVWELSTMNFHQFTFLTKRFLNVCRLCGARTEPPKDNVPESSVAIELKRDEQKQDPPPTFERLLRKYFGYTPLKDCSKCKAQGTRFRRRLIVGDLPPRLVVQPHADYRHMPGYATDEVSFDYEDPEGVERRAKYRWLGGIYLYNNHYRTYWNDSKVADRPQLLRLYDGQHHGGIIIGGIERQAPDAGDKEQRIIFEGWENGTDLLFYERTDNPLVESLSAVVQKAADDLDKQHGDGAGDGDNKGPASDGDGGGPGDGDDGGPGDGDDGGPGDGDDGGPGDGDDGGPGDGDDEDQGGDSYEIECLLDKRTLRRGRGKPVVEYLIKWKGYDHSHNRWYRIEDLADAQDLVVDYEQRHTTTT